MGTPDPRAEQPSQDIEPIEATLTNQMQARSEILASFTPDVAGSYVLSNTYTAPGGLLATFYRTKDFRDPVLNDISYILEVREGLMNL